MTQDTSGSGPMSKQSDSGKSKENKRDKNFQTKVVIRRLPPSMTEAQFTEQVAPVPPNDYFHFVKADLSLGMHAFTRAYLNFLSQEDVFIFKDKFDGYVFIDTKGNEYPAIVEFAPFQKIPKRRSKKRDAKCGTLAQDPEYLKFLSSLENPEEADETSGAPLPSAETYLEEIEARERDLKENGGAPRQTTPLIEYLKQRKLERQRMRDEKREERKRRELEKKKARDEERRKKKSTPSSGGHDKYDSGDSHSNRSGGSGHYYSKDSKDVNKKDSDAAGVKLMLLKNPERDDTRSTAGSSRSSASYHHDNYSYRDRNERTGGKDREKAAEKRNRDDGERFDRYRNDRGNHNNRDRDQNVRDKDVGGEKYEKNKETRDKEGGERTYEDKYNRTQDRDKDDRGGKGYMSRRERERQREKVAAARERERAKIQKEKDEKKSSKTSDAQNQKVKGFASKKEPPMFLPTSSTQDAGLIPDDPAIVAAAIEKPKPSSNASANSFVPPNNASNEGGSSSSGDSKDPRVERRIRNKDRPSLEIYRPGMRRLSSTNPSQGNSGGSATGKMYSNQSENNSQNDSGENSPRSCSPGNTEQVFDESVVTVDAQGEETLVDFEIDTQTLSDDNE